MCHNFLVHNCKILKITNLSLRYIDYFLLRSLILYICDVISTLNYGGKTGTIKKNDTKIEVQERWLCFQE